MRYLVDGMNVIGSRPDGWWRDRRGAQRALVDQLGSWATAGGHEVTVVFDGRPPEEGGGGGRETGGDPVRLRVDWAPGGRDAADHRIAAMVEADGRPSSLTVVTSDRALAARVTTAGAAVEAAGRFRSRLG